MVAWPDDDAYVIVNIGVEPGDQHGAGPVPDRSCRSPRRCASVVGVAALHNVMLVENLFMYGRLGFVEAPPLSEKGVNRIYAPEPCQGEG
jgi:hypothetical protein